MIRTIRTEHKPEWLFVIEVIKVTDASTPLSGRLNYAVSCILCDEEIANLDTMAEAETAGYEHECAA